MLDAQGELAFGPAVLRDSLVDGASVAHLYQQTFVACWSEPGNPGSVHYQRFRID